MLVLRSNLFDWSSSKNPHRGLAVGSLHGIGEPEPSRRERSLAVDTKGGRDTNGGRWPGIKWDLRSQDDKAKGEKDLKEWTPTNFERLIAHDSVQNPQIPNLATSKYIDPQIEKSITPFQRVLETVSVYLGTTIIGDPNWIHVAVPQIIIRGSDAARTTVVCSSEDPMFRYVPIMNN